MVACGNSDSQSADATHTQRASDGLVRTLARFIWLIVLVSFVRFCSRNVFSCDGRAFAPRLVRSSDGGHATADLNVASPPFPPR